MKDAQRPPKKKKITDGTTIPPHVYAELKRRFRRQKHIASALGIQSASVSGWLHGRARPSAMHALRIHEITNGEIGAHEVRPDLFGDMELQVFKPRKARGEQANEKK